MSKVKSRTVLMVGCFDTKAADFHFLYSCLVALDLEVLSINTGIFGSTTLFPVAVEAAEIALASKTSIEQLRKKNDRAMAIEKMGAGASFVISELRAKQNIDGIIGMGGGGGTYIFLAAIQKIPFGVPKLCLSTLATKDLSIPIGSKDVTLIPTLVDVVGVNAISSILMNRAAGALAGMISVDSANFQKPLPSIAISVFGNTTPCVEYCTSLLNEEGYETLSFHAVGSGGRTMEGLIEDDCFEAVLDITTTELADDLFGGICSAGPNRLTAAGIKGIPQIVVPGCLDMVNFGTLDTVPENYRNRQLFSWSPDVTLMRTNADENRILGKSFAEKLNRSTGEVVVLFPLKGISKISKEGEVFYAPEVDVILFDSIREYLNEAITIIEVEANINDIEFAEKAVQEVLKLIT